MSMQLWGHGLTINQGVTYDQAGKTPLTSSEEAVRKDNLKTIFEAKTNFVKRKEKEDFSTSGGVNW